VIEIYFLLSVPMRSEAVFSYLVVWLVGQSVRQSHLKDLLLLAVCDCLCGGFFWNI